MATLADLQVALDSVSAEVEQQTTVVNSATVLLTDLKRMLDDALSGGGTPDEVIARIQAIASALDANEAALAEAVAANTPGA